MEKHEIEKVIQQVINQLHLGKSSFHEKPGILVVEPTSRNISRQPIDLLDQCWNVMTYQPEKRKNSLPAYLNKAVFLEAEQDLLVKAAIGVTDTEESSLFSELIMKGFQIYFNPGTSLRWILEDDKSNDINPIYLDHLAQYKEMLEKFGVLFSSVENIKPKQYDSQPLSTHEKNDRYTSKLLTQGDVERWRSKHTYVQRDTIVTPLARDTAKELGITISVEKS